VALTLAWAVGDEPFSVRTVAAGLTVLGAVYLIWSGSTRRQPACLPKEKASPSPLRELARFRVLV
jgi:hypothetical protein